MRRVFAQIVFLPQRRLPARIELTSLLDTVTVFDGLYMFSGMVVKTSGTGCNIAQAIVISDNMCGGSPTSALTNVETVGLGSTTQKAAFA